RERERQRRPALEIADEWARLVAEQRRQIEPQAARVSEALRRQLDTNWRERNANREPTRPTGLFAAFQRGGYERELAVYQQRRERLEARQVALLRRLRFVEQCRLINGWHMAGEAGERLAEARAAHRRSSGRVKSSNSSSATVSSSSVGRGGVEGRDVG
ncbi:MAG: hypothetical protein U7M05_12465, partial [Candidatus Igneacidithiobacillus chanchocoensis]